MLTTSNIATKLKNDVIHGNFVTDKTGAKTVEIIGASFCADAPAIFGEPNEAYINCELDWYRSESTNINDIYPDKTPPAAWKYAADKYGNINSNYGKLIYSEQYNHQYVSAMCELKRNRDSRRAVMIYNRPSIWTEYNNNGMSDFICTNAVSYHIRDNDLYVTVQMRSNDAVFGYKNDYAWQQYVANELKKDLGDINNIYMYWQVQSLHLYERHFDLIGE